MTHEEENAIIAEAVRRLPKMWSFYLSAAGGYSIGPGVSGLFPAPKPLLELCREIITDTATFPAVEDK